jgi:hypothetical protein
LTEAETERWQTVVEGLDGLATSPARGPRVREHVRTGRIDWSAMIFALEAAGMSQREIGQQCDSDQTWVQRLKNIPGTQPKFHNGLLLLGLWVNATGKAPAEAPVA